MNTGTTHHFTSDLRVLNDISSYNSDATLILGNRSKIHITHIGHTQMNCESYDLKLKGLL